MNDRPHLSDELIERAVEIWCRLLQRPKHDNGAMDSAETPEEVQRAIMTTGLAGILLESQMKDVDDYPAAIERFRTVLTRNLKYARDREGEEMSEAESIAYYGDKAENLHFRPTFRCPRELGCDYGPCRELSEAAKESGLPGAAFSWKTDVIMERYSNMVSVRAGYAAPAINHYPMGDGIWLITDLTGYGDMEKVKAAALAGLIDLQVERP